MLLILYVVVAELVRNKAAGENASTITPDLYARQRWKQIQFLADQFRKRWSRVHTGLTAEAKWLQPKRSLMVGDVVMIADESLPRNT